MGFTLSKEGCSPDSDDDVPGDTLSEDSALLSWEKNFCFNLSTSSFFPGPSEGVALNLVDVRIDGRREWIIRDGAMVASGRSIAWPTLACLIDDRLE